jgi:hypothetical protein
MGLRLASPFCRERPPKCREWHLLAYLDLLILSHLVRDFNSSASAWIWRSVSISSSVLVPSLLLHESRRDRGGEEGEEADPHEHQAHADQPPLHGRRVEVAVPDRRHGPAVK